MLQTIGNIIAGYFAADFVSGIGHWLEDTYLKTDTPLFGSIAAANQMHHLRPALMCHFNYFQTVKTTFGLLLPVYVACLYFGVGLNPGVITFFLATLNVNEFHKWSHMQKKELWYPVQMLQNARIILNRQDHKLHHTRPFNSQYCVVSGGMNYILDGIGFWRFIEAVIYYTTGAEPRKNDDPEIWTTYEKIYPGLLASAGIQPHENGPYVAKPTSSESTQS